MNIQLNTQKITKCLAVFIIGLYAASVAVNVADHVLGHHRLLGLIHWFDLDTEGNIPTWYQSSSLLFCAFLLYLISRTKREQRDMFAGHWSLLAGIFIYLSADEAAQIHENLGYLLCDVLRWKDRTPFPWVFLGSFFTAMVSFNYLRFLKKLPVRYRIGFLGAAAVYLTGTLILETWGSAFYNQAHGMENIYYHVVSDAEELFEMIGILVFIRTLLLYLSNESRVTLAIGRGREDAR